MSKLQVLKFKNTKNSHLRIKNLANQLAKIDLAQQKREESEKAKVWV